MPIYLVPSAIPRATRASSKSQTVITGHLPGQIQQSQAVSAIQLQSQQYQRHEYQQPQLQPQQSQRPTPARFHNNHQMDREEVQSSGSSNNEQQGNIKWKEEESSGWFSKLLVQAIHMEM